MPSPVLSNLLATLKELKEDPLKVMNNSKGEAVAILDKNKPVFYCILAEQYQSLLERISKLKKDLLKTEFINFIKLELRKRPSAINHSTATHWETLAKALGCTPSDFQMSDEELEILKKEKIKQEEEEKLNKFLKKRYEDYTYTELMPETVAVVNELVQKNKDENLTAEQFLAAIKEIYLQSIQRDLKKVDREFAEWFIDRLSDC